MTIQQEINRLGELSPWYHHFEIEYNGELVIIEGRQELYPVWDNITNVREAIDYKGKRVLDQGCRDGMWAFEAESSGASVVIGTDIGDDGYREHATFIKSAICSKVGFYFNVPTEQVFERLDTFFHFNPGLFDIVQHLGLLYHVQDPLRSLRQTRRCMNTGGYLLLETAYWLDEGKPAALFNSNSDIYKDDTTFWAFNRSGLYGALALCGFEPQTASESFAQTENIGRICLIAKAL